jgi:hypothetical protein
MNSITLPNDATNAGKKLGCFKITISNVDYYIRGTVVNDPANDIQARAMDSAPVGTEGALVTRNIPSGTQPVSNAGTFAVQAGQSGTWNITNISGTVSLPTGAATESTLSTLNGKVTACNTGAVTISAALPAGSNAIGKLAANSGVTIGAVELAAAQTLSVTNTGTFAVQAAQSGTWNIGSITTVGGTVAVTGTFWQATQPVSLASVPSHAVTNAGTFAVQATLAAETTKVIGTVNLSAAQTLAAITSITNVVHVDDNAGSITIDAPVATPAFVRLSDGAAAISTLPVSLASVPTHAITHGFVTDTTTGDTGTKVATFAGATQTNSNGASGAIVTVKCGTVSGTSPTLSCQFQWSYDGGTTWLNMGTAIANLTATNNTGVYLIGPNNWSVAGAAPAALTTGATQTTYLNLRLPKTWRINYTIGGTSPSFAITNVYVNYTN